MAEQLLLSGVDSQGNVVTQTIQVEVTATPPATPDLGSVIGGTWLLQQTTSSSQDLSSLMETCFDKVPSAVGFGIRYPLNQVIDASGNLITTSGGLLRRFFEDLIQINEARGTGYIASLRPINGQYCPAAWRAAMPAQLLFTDDVGLAGIHPCYTAPITHAHDGLPTHSHAIGDPNDIYEIRWRKYLQQLVALVASDPRYEALVRFIHGTYYSLEYSEYYYGPPVQSQNTTYTAAKHRAAHKRLATIMFEEMPADVAVEWASTGHGPMVGTYTGTSSSTGSNPFIEDMCDHLVGLYGSGSDRVYFSFNGWSDVKVSGAPDAATEFSKQWAARHRTNRAGNIRVEIQDIAANWVGPWDAAYDWAHGGGNDVIGNLTGSMPPRRMLGKAFNGGPDTYLQNGVYPIEVYAFRCQGNTGNALYSAQLEANAAAHRAHVLSLFTPA